MSAPFPAAAQSAVAEATDQQKAAASETFKRGNQAYSDLRYADALEAFRASWAIVQSPNTRLMIARSLRALKRGSEAQAELRAVVSDAEEAAKTDPKYRQTADAARQELVELEARLAKEPARAPAELPPPLPLPPEQVEPPYVEPFPRFTVGIVAAGVGVAGFALSGLFGGLALGKRNDLDDGCVDKRCPATLEATAEEGETFQTTSNVMFAIGVIGVVSGGGLIAWHFLDPSAEPGAEAGLVVGPGSVAWKAAF